MRRGIGAGADRRGARHARRRRGAPAAGRGERRTRPAGRARRGRHRGRRRIRGRRARQRSSEWQLRHSKFDAIIIGAGQAGPPLAGRLTAAGQTVAVIERKLVGGTCVNYGCIPTKTLVASAHAAHIARRGAEYGIGTGDVTVDMAKVKARKDKVMTDDREGVESWLEGMDNCTLIRGHARFTDPHTDPRRRPGPAGRQDLPQRRRPGRGARYAGAVRHRLPDQRRDPRTRHAARTSGHHRRQLHRARVRADVPPVRRAGHRRSRRGRG